MFALPLAVARAQPEPPPHPCGPDLPRAEFERQSMGPGDVVELANGSPMIAARQNTTLILTDVFNKTQHISLPEAFGVPRSLRFALPTIGLDAEGRIFQIAPSGRVLVDSDGTFEALSVATSVTPRVVVVRSKGIDGSDLLVSDVSFTPSSEAHLTLRTAMHRPGKVAQLRSVGGFMQTAVAWIETASGRASLWLGWVSELGPRLSSEPVRLDEVAVSATPTDIAILEVRPDSWVVAWSPVVSSGSAPQVFLGVFLVRRGSEPVRLRRLTWPAARRQERGDNAFHPSRLVVTPSGGRAGSAGRVTEVMLAWIEHRNSTIVRAALAEAGEPLTVFEGPVGNSGWLYFDMMGMPNLRWARGHDIRSRLVGVECENVSSKASAKEVVPFSQIFDVDPEKGVTPKVPIRIGRATLTPGRTISRGEVVSGVDGTISRVPSSGADLFTWIRCDLVVSRQGDMVVIIGQARCQ